MKGSEEEEKRKHLKRDSAEKIGAHGFGRPDLANFEKFSKIDKKNWKKI